jgi:hypothetical protein
MSNFDKTVDLFSSPYLTVLGKVAGREPLEMPDRKNNFKYTRQNMQKMGVDDKMHEADINHITYFGSPVNVIDLDLYLSPGHANPWPGDGGSGGGSR